MKEVDRTGRPNQNVARVDDMNSTSYLSSIGWQGRKTCSDSFRLAPWQDELVVELQWAQPLEDLLATMTPANTMRGFTLGFSTSSQTLTTCSRLLFLTTCLDTPVEQFCGSYSGPCLEKTLDASGEPVPGQFEPAICVYSKSLCGKEADVKAQITPEALGVNILSEAPCTPATGLPNTSMCNAVSSLGVDPQTMLPRTIDPMAVLTPEAQAELDATLATAESTVNLMLDIAIALSPVSP